MEISILAHHEHIIRSQITLPVFILGFSPGGAARGEQNSERPPGGLKMLIFQRRLRRASQIQGVARGRGGWKSESARQGGQPPSPLQGGGGGSKHFW